MCSISLPPKLQCRYLSKYLASHKNLKVITFIVLQIFVMPIATMPNQKPGQQWQAVLPLLHGMLDRKLNKSQNSNGNNLNFGNFCLLSHFLIKHRCSEKLVRKLKINMYFWILYKALMSAIRWVFLRNRFILHKCNPLLFMLQELSSLVFLRVVFLWLIFTLV